MSDLSPANPDVGAVILAAGDSRRMGEPKALLTRGGETFLEHWLRVLGEAKVREIRVVLGRDGQAIRQQVPLPEPLVVIQPAPEEGMLSSLRLGLAALPQGLAGLFLCPVDHPLVESGLLTRMRAALRPGTVVLPVHDGQRGHPVLFAAALFPEIESADPEQGARVVVRADRSRVIEVEAGPGVLEDVDTPEAFRRLRRH